MIIPQLVIESYSIKAIKFYDQLFLTNPIILKDENRSSDKYGIMVSRQGSEPISRFGYYQKGNAQEKQITTLQDFGLKFNLKLIPETFYDITIYVSSGKIDIGFLNYLTLQSSKRIYIATPHIQLAVNGITGSLYSFKSEDPIFVKDKNRCSEVYVWSIQEYDQLGKPIGQQTRGEFKIAENASGLDLRAECQSLGFQFRESGYYKIRLGIDSHEPASEVMVKIG